jgi:2-dehydro-3-deoxyphosphogluconate aldolase/(4S)-4-hydroxy-2-oxoglutarate aldolase
MIDPWADLIGTDRVLLILRALDPATTVARAEAAWAAGIRLVEVTIGTPDGLASLRAAVEAATAHGHPVLAGTVLTPDAARHAAAAGAAGTVAPGLDLDVLVASRDAGLPHLPGVATPSEVQRAMTAGCGWVKAFPAVSLGPAWFRTMRGPFPTMRFIATGGVTASTAPDLLAAGATAVGLGATADLDLTALAAL